MMYWPKITPVLEDKGYKRIGSGQTLIEYCCHRGFEQKRDEKGKVIKPKKGVPPMKSLCPKDL